VEELRDALRYAEFQLAKAKEDKEILEKQIRNQDVQIGQTHTELRARDH